ncbi:hypothetical protein CEXT_396751 [Caerostris extrusa]|uniref:Uncharacterized protein n=1 Tax=Caerostris extrusa TaxID=172846 RepID=A0AAV4W477_CAEEX|nr:hypothetical protein CEXT_396751 [Caerostris extrusa]
MEVNKDSLQLYDLMGLNGRRMERGSRKTRMVADRYHPNDSDYGDALTFNEAMTMFQTNAKARPLYLEKRLVLGKLYGHRVEKIL